MVPFVGFSLWARRARDCGRWLGISAGLGLATVGAEPRIIHDRLELFVDRYLIEEMSGVRLELGEPRAEEEVLPVDRPWEVPGIGGVTVLKDGPIYRLYYRGGERLPNGAPDSSKEVTCYAESRDGIHWEKPVLGLHEFRGRRENNIILRDHYAASGKGYRVSHNFAPYLDDRPGVPPAERYKAVGGHPSRVEGDPWGLLRYVSADGIHWRLFSEEPLFYGYPLDSRNVLMWLPEEGCYAIYLRSWTAGGDPGRPTVGGYRAVSRSVSKDFLSWSEPETMTYGDAPPEHIYQSGTYPYYRAPHLLIALAWRMLPGRQVVSPAELDAYGVHPTQRRGVHEVVLMSSRGGTHYTRTFMEAFIRPGLDRKGWHARNLQPSLGGVVPTGPEEMSFYVSTHNTLPSAHLRRYALRLDGFASLRAGYTPGFVTTKPLIFRGGRLVLNYSTSAVGSLRVELQDEQGRPLPGHALADCDEVVGDEIARAVSWRGQTNVAALAGKVVRLHFVMKDADLYSLQFTSSQ